MTGLSFFWEPAQPQLNTRSESLSFEGVHPGVILPDAQDTSSVGGFGVMNKEEYRQKCLDPRWQKKRLQILERDGWKCGKCKDETTTLHVHHRYYENDADPWDYPDTALITLCAPCHEYESAELRNAEQKFLLAMKRAGIMADNFDYLADALKGEILSKRHFCAAFTELLRHPRLQALVALYFHSFVQIKSLVPLPSDEEFDGWVEEYHARQKDWGNQGN